MIKQVEPTEARAGEKSGRVRNILLTSLVVLIVAFVLAYFLS